MNGPVVLGWGDVALAASLVLLNAGLSLWLGIGLGQRILIASVRTVVQLTLLGFVLVPVFAIGHPGVVFALGALMILLAAREAVARSERVYAGIHGSALVSLLVGSGATAVVGAAFVVGVEPWWTPRYLVPLLGMILGNGLTGISLGLDRCLALLDEERGRVEVALALGATRWEAARPVAADAVRTGMIPILNAMSAVGLVTIPGMMTGQILGGTDPVQAARYQIVILFLIAGAVALGVGGTVLLSVAALFDDQHRLRVERLRRR